MSDPVVCNVCWKPITDPDEAKKDRVYIVLATGRPLPRQKKHDICDEAYAKERIGLKKVS